MKILIVDDDRTTHVVLSAILDKHNFEIYSAYDGASALDMFECVHPKIVLMDVYMPRMDGLDAAREIKVRSGENYVPIIFITSDNSPESIKKYVDCGGDDFIFKPFDVDIVSAKITAIARTCGVHEKTVTHSLHLDNELDIAAHVYNTILDKTRLELPYLEYRSQAASRFCSDLLLCGTTPAGGVNFLLMDFGGYGLSAAMCSIALLDIFYSMTNKGFLATDIIAELDEKLKFIFPENMFCAAVIGSIDPEKTSVTIWNGGMPDVLITTADRKIVNRVESSRHQLGASTEDDFNSDADMFPLDPTSRLYIMSDGLLEERNSKDERFGQKRLEEILAGTKTNADSDIFDGLFDYGKDVHQIDDITFAEINIDNMDDGLTSTKKNTQVSKVPSTWSAGFSFDALTLRDINVVPMILNIVMEVQSPVEHRERLFTIVSELFNNALEHGVLKLDSAMKLDHTSFIEYYEQREKRLAALTDAQISLQLTHEPTAEGGQLIIVIEDTGAGFNYKAPPKKMDAIFGLSGRGVALVKDLCSSVEYSGRGNIVTVVYDWS